MLSETLNLDSNCENCQSNEYMEHDSGFYVCTNCATVSHMRHGLALEYKDLNTKGMKFKKQNIDEEEVYQIDLNNYETNVNTINNTCANSDYNDSNYSRYTYGEAEKKPLSEVLLDHQNIFIKLFKTIFFFQFCKKIKNFPKEENSNLNFLKDFNKNSINIFYENLFLSESNENNDEFFSLKNTYEKLLDIAKEKWFDFIKSEYENQILKKPSFFRKQKNQARSRRNTEDESNILNTNINNSKNKNLYKDKKYNLNEEYNKRGIKSRNVEKIEDYNKCSLRIKEKKRKFMEEFDQVLSILKESQDFIKIKTNIDINKSLHFKDMLIIADLFNIKTNENSTYEDIIHSFFITKELNYISLFSEKLYDENKSKLNSDNFLTILYDCFNSKINQLNKDYPLMIYELITLYKKFNLNNLHSHEIKFLKYISREKLFKSLDKINKPFTLSYQIINYACCKNLNLPIFFSDFAKKIFKFCEFSILRHKTYTDNYEAFSLAAVILSLRYFYGLNDLPYLTDLRKFDFSTNRIFEEKKFQKILDLFEDISIKDKIYKYYKELPSILEIIEILILKIKKEEKNICLWEADDFKKFSAGEYKEKFVNYINLSFYPKFENNSCVRNINELEKRINKQIYKTLSFKDDCESNNRKISNLSVNQKEFKTNLDSVKINFSENFLKKIKEKNLKNYENLKEENNLNEKNNNKLNVFNNFLKEEFEFYEMISKKNKKNKNKNMKINIPLPCDTVVRFNKKAFKFEGMVPPTSELMIYYLFSRLYKIEVQVLRKCMKVLEKVIDENFK